MAAAGVRDKLHAEFPDALMPETLQKYCRESHPNQAKIAKSPVVGSSDDTKTRQNRSKTTSPKQSDTAPKADKPAKLTLTTPLAWPRKQLQIIRFSRRGCARSGDRYRRDRFSEAPHAMALASRTS